ncbi:MAG: Gfo/Idh/MocA family oxidoreductase [Candidatus Omnitrophica bacterium]|nr:Gfo/Idh/MocA family oxidoreductase [Candidatus Omnitrophota bacterium]
MKLRVGIIGLGVGELHIKGYNMHPECEVVALCDFSDEKLTMAREKYPDMKITRQAGEILEDQGIDVVSIASYDNYHYEQIVKAFANNKHIFVEKPFCLYEEQAIHIRTLLRDKPQLKMSSNLILRKCPRFRLLKEMIEARNLGELFYIEGDYNYGRLHKITEGWRSKIDFYSVIYGGGVHIIDLLLWLTKDLIVEVMAYGNNISSRGTRFRYNDMVTCILKFKSGIVGKVAVNMGCVFPHFHPLSVYGTKATFVNGLEHGLLFKSRNPLKGPEKIQVAYPGVHKGDLIYSFIDSILNGFQGEVSQKEIFNSMSVCFAIEKAVNRRRPVAVKYI